MTSPAGVAIEMPHNASYRGSARADVMRLLPKLKDGLKILEIGCGEGAFCTSVPGGAEIWGVEPEARSAEVARLRLHKVFVTTFDDAKAGLPRHYFDLIICNDVMEHMTDHDAFLVTIQDYLAPGGYLVGSVPNVRFAGHLFNLVAAGDWHYQDSGVLDRTHFRFFTLRSLRRSLEGAGLVVRRLEGLNAGDVTGWGPRALVERAFRAGMMALSLGRAQDIRFYQIGFLVSAGAP